METEYAKGRMINYLARRWRTSFSRFVRDCLVPSGLFAEPFGQMVAPPSSVARLSEANIRLDGNGQSVYCKLLTNVPLNLTDSEAMELLADKIKSDIRFVERWATIKVASLWHRYLRRKSCAEVESIDLDGATIKHIWNEGNSIRDKSILVSAKRFEKFGFLTPAEYSSRAYPLKRNDLAIELGLPVIGALFPHCALLTLNHPQITPSFLANLELFDRNDMLIGFVQDGKNSYLHGAKLRKGASHAQQIICLNEITTTVVQQIISITECVRNYLRQRGDDSWRYLLLSTGSAISYPRRILNLATETSSRRRTELLSADISLTCAISSRAAEEFVQRFSLTTLRASCGVLVYLETNDAKKMSETLGHTHYDGRLLKHYLPKAIQVFFQERWVRIFQTGLIVVALNESRHLLKASGFSNIKELDEFLKNHALRLIPEDTNVPKPSVTSDSGQVVFGVDTAVLTILLSIKAAVADSKKNVNETAKYWATIAGHIENYICGPACLRNDLKGFLKNAKLRVSTKEVMALIYE